MRTHREGQEHSCTVDSETTPWLKHTGWPERFWNRPLDIISTSARLPVRGPNIYKEELLLGTWRGELLCSSPASEAHIRVLVQAVDDMFDRAEHTLACTPYQSRCWLMSYEQRMFRHRPLRTMSAATARAYRSKWKKFICYVFRAFEMGLSTRRGIYNMPLRSEDKRIMRRVLRLASEVITSSIEKDDRGTVGSSELRDSDGDDDDDGDSDEEGEEDEDDDDDDESSSNSSSSGNESGGG